jgi:hypothetical protein
MIPPQGLSGKPSHKRLRPRKAFRGSAIIFVRHIRRPQGGSMAMTAEQLKAIQGPLTEQDKANPDSALMTLCATGRALAGVSCAVERGAASVSFVRRL